MCESLSACRLYFPGDRSSSCRDRFFSPIPEPLLSVSFFGKLLFSISHSITPGEGSDILIFTKDRVDALVPCLKAFSMSVMKSNGINTVMEKSEDEQTIRYIIVIKKK